MLYYQGLVIDATLYFLANISPDGIEPPSQGPESCVISITLRERQLPYHTWIMYKNQGVK